MGNEKKLKNINRKQMFNCLNYFCLDLEHVEWMMNMILDIVRNEKSSLHFHIFMELVGYWLSEDCGGRGTA